MQSKNKQQFSNKSFGLMVTVLLLIAGIYFYLKQNNLFYFLILLAIINLILTLFFQWIYTKPARYWYKLGMLLHTFISPVIMLIVYFFAIVIIGLLMKVFRKDPLLKKNDPDAPSYWVKRRQSIKRYFNLNNHF